MQETPPCLKSNNTKVPKSGVADSEYLTMEVDSDMHLTPQISFL